MSKRRVVVTGVGMLTPIGNTAAEAWTNALAGASGAASDPDVRHPGSCGQVQLVGQGIRSDAVHGQEGSAPLRPVHPIRHGGRGAGDRRRRASNRIRPTATAIGVAIGSGIGGILTIEDTHSVLLESGPRACRRSSCPASVINMISGNVSIVTDFAARTSPSSRRARPPRTTSASAMRMIQYGDADVMIAGGAECATTPTSVGGVLRR